jgi:hypothetical protein
MANFKNNDNKQGIYLSVFYCIRTKNILTMFCYLGNLIVNGCGMSVWEILRTLLKGLSCNEKVLHRGKRGALKKI